MNTPRKYEIRQQVSRSEDRAQVLAQVLATAEGPMGQVLELAYQEGGSGWWPAVAVEPAEANFPT
jgi:hypothetical protein